MRYKSFINAYQQAVREAFHDHLAGLGFTLKKERNNTLVAVSAHSRILFSHFNVVLCIQRISTDPKQACSAYDLGMLLEAIGMEDEYHLEPLTGPEVMKSEVDRMVRVLVEKCRSLLDGDDFAWQQVYELAARKTEQVFEQMSEAGLHLKEDGKWRELPELDAVRAKGPNKLINILITFLLLVIPGAYTLFLLVMYFQILFGPPQPGALLMCLLLTVLGIPMILLNYWILENVLFCQYYWETSSVGLTIGGLFKNRLIPWSSVDCAAKLPHDACEIRTTERTIRLDKGALKNTYLEASIWQHLNRLEKADTFPLSPHAASFWAQIPSIKTAEIHWENPKPAYALDVLIRLALWEALIWGAALHFKLDIVSHFLVIATCPVISAGYGLMLIKRVSVLADGIDAETALGKQRVPWEAVKSVKFVNACLNHPPCLLIRSGAFRYMRIPWIPKHPNSTRVLLEIIRRLRQEERFKFLPFPTILLFAALDEGNGDH